MPKTNNIYRFNLFKLINIYKIICIYNEKRKDKNIESLNIFIGNGTIKTISISSNTEYEYILRFLYQNNYVIIKFNIDETNNITSIDSNNIIDIDDLDKKLEHSAIYMNEFIATNLEYFNNNEYVNKFIFNIINSMDLNTKEYLYSIGDLNIYIEIGYNIDNQIIYKISFSYRFEYSTVIYYRKEDNHNMIYGQILYSYRVYRRELSSFINIDQYVNSIETVSTLLTTTYDINIKNCNTDNILCKVFKDTFEE